MIALKTAYVDQIKQENLDLLMDRITYGSKPYFSKALKKSAVTSPENCAIICEYILVEITEMNIKQSTKEGKLKVLIWLSIFLQHVPFHKMIKQNILSYLDSLRQPSFKDPNQKWIGSYNSRQMILNKFFRWLYNTDEPDPKRRVTPICMRGVKKLPRQEKSPYKPSDLWDSREHSIFLKYCPSKRDRCYHAMANDMSARPHEILNLKIKDVIFKLTPEKIQYAEILIRGGKTKPRTLPLIDSIPYVKDWIANHPTGDNPESLNQKQQQLFQIMNSKIGVSFLIIALAIGIHSEPSLFSTAIQAISDDHHSLRGLPAGDPVASSVSHFPNICIRCNYPWSGQVWLGHLDQQEQQVNLEHLEGWDQQEQQEHLE